MGFSNITMPRQEAEERMERLKTLKAGEGKFGRSGIMYKRKLLSGSEFDFRLKKWGK